MIPPKQIISVHSIGLWTSTWFMWSSHVLVHTRLPTLTGCFNQSPLHPLRDGPWIKQSSILSSGPPVEYKYQPSPHWLWLYNTPSLLHLFLHIHFHLHIHLHLCLPRRTLQNSEWLKHQTITAQSKSWITWAQPSLWRPTLQWLIARPSLLLPVFLPTVLAISHPQQQLVSTLLIVQCTSMTDSTSRDWYWWHDHIFWNSRRKSGLPYNHLRLQHQPYRSTCEHFSYKYDCRWTPSRNPGQAIEQ